MGDFYDAHVRVPSKFMSPELEQVVLRYYGRSSFQELNSELVYCREGIWQFEDFQARNGELTEIEHFCEMHNIPFDRWCESTGSNSPATIRIFRPDGLDIELPETDEGIVVPLSKLKEIWDLDSTEEIFARMGKLMQEYDPQYRPLESYQIEDGGTQ
jgi:hypothetical protein